MKRLGLLLLAAMAGVGHAEYRVVDEIAAVVQDEVITTTDVEEQLQLLLIQMQAEPADAQRMADSLRPEVLRQLIDNILVVKEAERKAIKVSDQEIDSYLEKQIQEQATRLGGEDKLIAQLEREGVTLKQMRAFIREDIRRQLLSSQLVGAEVPTDIDIPQDKVAAYYASHRAEFPAKPDRLHLRHLFIGYSAGSDRDEAAKKTLAAARARIVAGEDFATVAREISKDPTADRGGDMGFFRKKDLADPLFADAAFALPDSGLSEVVSSYYGYHLIQRLESKGDQIHIRHIVIPHEVTNEDRARAKARMDEVVRALGKGVPFVDLVRKSSDAKEPDGDIGFFPIDALYPGFQKPIAALQVGQVTNPIEDEQGLHLFELLERTSDQAYALEEIAPQIREALRREEISKRYRAWVDKLRERSYVEIRGRAAS